MEFKEKRAEEYTEGKSSSPVFSENHKRDFLAGYEQALKDSKAPEMLEMLKIVVNDYKNIIPQSPARDSRVQDIEELIKEVTEINGK